MGFKAYLNGNYSAKLLIQSLSQLGGWMTSAQLVLLMSRYPSVDIDFASERVGEMFLSHCSEVE